MRSTVAVPDDRRYRYELSYGIFVEELVAAIATLVPEVRVVDLEGGVRFGRGNVTAELRSYRADVVTVIFRQDCERVLAGGVPITPAALDDLAADLVGFFCGAPIATLALFPRPPAPAVAPKRRRRPGPYDAPLVPLPFETAFELRRR